MVIFWIVIITLKYTRINASWNYENPDLTPGRAGHGGTVPVVGMNGERGSIPVTPFCGCLLYTLIKANWLLICDSSALYYCFLCSDHVSGNLIENIGTCNNPLFFSSPGTGILWFHAQYFQFYISMNTAKMTDGKLTQSVDLVSRAKTHPGFWGVSKPRIVRLYNFSSCIISKACRLKWCKEEQMSFET